MSNSNQKSDLMNNLDSITNDVSNLFKKIDSPNERLFNRKITNDVQLHGYVDPASLYRTNQNTKVSSKLMKDNNLVDQQNNRLVTPSGDIKYVNDNRQNLYPNSEINEYNNLRGAVINNNDGKPFKNASIRDTTLVYDTLLTEKEKAVLRERAKAQLNPQLNTQYDLQQVTSQYQPSSKDSRDSRYIFYPENEIAPNTKQHRSDRYSNPGDESQPKSQPKSQLGKQSSTGDVFTHNSLSNRDRVPIDPKNLYRSADYESTPFNSLDQEVTYDKRKNLINSGELQYPTGTVFTHNAQRDRVPIDPTNLYRSADYASTPYNTLDMDVEHVPRVAQVNTTADYMLNREFDIVNDNKTSKDENAEVSMIHTPYTPLDKFDRSDVRFKNINEKKPQVDVLNEYIVNIDSADRNVTFYPNQFSIRILFNPTADAAVMKDANGNLLQSAANPDLKIEKGFENIKYLRLETATFPRYYNLKLSTATSATPSLGDANEQTILAAVITTINTNKANSAYNFRAYINSVGGSYSPPSGYTTQYVAYTWTSATNINAKFNVVNSSNVSIAYELAFNGTSAQTVSNRYIVDTSKDLSTDRYIILDIDEITDNTQNSTNGKNQYNYLFPDYITTNYFYGDNHYVDKIYKNTKLGVIKNLTITMSDSFGNLINGGTYMDTVNSTSDSSSTTDVQSVTTVYNDSLTYIRHPYYRNFQLTLMFKIGCYETEIDKKIFY